MNRRPGTCILTEDDVHEILDAYEQGQQIDHAKYGVSKRTIEKICQAKSWWVVHEQRSLAVRRQGVGD